ncbi:5'-nucleotidase domain-containing protein 2 [Pteropus alecto]|uniref:5'-nucleotidase domain-containing protein 2 n=1 Tax=Pteropus alecto TaxID=9402 RepID=L5KVZ1_PTEAL|nr:5'-nucleotidase domain-containing protein 2 [Pteropus alecto]
MRSACVTLRSALAQYADSLHPESFNATHDILIEHHQYSEGIRRYEHKLNFVIHGLHYDIQKETSDEDSCLPSHAMASRGLPHVLD